MAYEITAALIQGGCTVVAAGIAVVAALTGVKAWRHEAPGRRRLQLAEECLVAAYSAHSALEGYSFAIRRFVADDLRADPHWLPDGRREAFKRLRETYSEVRGETGRLRDITKTASLYFGDRLMKAYRAMRLYELELETLYRRARDLSDEGSGVSEANRSYTPCLGWIRTSKVTRSLTRHAMIPSPSTRRC